MSATPEQIADLCDRLKKRVLNADDLDVASSLIRAQAERVRVLEEENQQLKIGLEVAEKLYRETLGIKGGGFG